MGGYNFSLLTSVNNLSLGTANLLFLNRCGLKLSASQPGKNWIGNKNKSVLTGQPSSAHTRVYVIVAASKRLSGAPTLATVYKVE